jgi:oxygen-independent coproporphyrinogen-3 oxidase
MKNRILKYNRQIPRYTSYPTAPHFLPATADDYTEALQQIPPQSHASLYIHIPFCKEMCWYCGCHTSATRKYAPVEQYVSLLTSEMRMVSEKIRHRQELSHIHFGGGSPSMLQPEDFDRIMCTAADCFRISEKTEIAVEADPRNTTADRIDCYATNGVNRLSFGIQDFSANVQAAINRVQGFEEVRKAVSLARNAGIHNINFDLMYGLPLQTCADVEKTVELSLSLKPQRFAVFGYAHVPWMKKHMRLIKNEDLPDASARIDQFSAAEKMLVKAGLVPVGMDHFVTKEDSMFNALKEKCLARNFQGYTTDTATILLGIGASSIGHTSQSYFQNMTPVSAYQKSILEGTLPTSRSCTLSTDDRLRAQIISDIMCYLEADIGEHLSAHKLPAETLDKVLAGLNDLEIDGIITLKNRKIRVSPETRQLTRVVCAHFDSYLKTGSVRHSQAA